MAGTARPTRLVFNYSVNGNNNCIIKAADGDWDMNERLRLLRDFFPTAVFTGKALIFISEEFRVELTEHTRGALSAGESVPITRVRLFHKGPTGEFELGHYEDFELPDINETAEEIEKFVQFAVGKNLKE
jgi:hypothetical protein